MASLDGLLAKLKAEDGYQEKASNSNLDSKNGNAGYNNYTKYSRDINKVGLMGCQGQAWCGTFQFWSEYTVFGLAKALENFCMTKNTYVAYNVFSTREAFRKKDKYVKVPKVGYLVIFKQSHIGRVLAVTSTHITVMEGNTSAKYGDRNGGTVKSKTYNRSDSIIDGYCAIEYSQAEVTPKTGWLKEPIGWWYRNVDGSWAASKWQYINARWYYFDSNGYAVTGWIRLSGKWYYLNKAGEGTECAMVTGWREINDKWYYFDPSSGAMVTSQWVDKWYVGVDGDWIVDYKS